MDRINQVWPRWHTVELIGRGAFGEVYKAKREELGETFYSAVKVIQIPREEQEIQELLNEGHTSQSIQDYYESLARDLMNEIKVMETLKSAANVVNIEEFEIRKRVGEIGWEAFIRMELLQNLNEYRAGKNLSAKEVVKLGIDICQALICCQQNQIIHRDIKPSNIFVDTYGQFKLGDFGISRQLEKTQSTLSQKGTEAYMAPEAHRGEKGSYNVDLYSLGMVLYRLLNKNKMPFEPMDKELCTYQEREEALNRRLQGDRLPLPVGADESLGKIICKACADKKEERYQSAEEMKKALETWSQGKFSERKSDRQSQQKEAGKDRYQTREIRAGQKSFILNLENGEKLRVTVPPNAQDGMKIRLKGKGQSSERGGIPGDLYVTLRILAEDELDETMRVRRATKKTNSGFAGEKASTAFGASSDMGSYAGAGKRGKDIRLTQRVKTGQKDFIIELSEGKKVLVKIPEGSKTGSIIRLDGRGEPGENGGKAGDLFITLDLEKREVQTKLKTRLAARGPLVLLILLLVLADEWRIWQISPEGAKIGTSMGQWLMEHRDWWSLICFLGGILLVYFGHRYIAGGICVVMILMVGSNLKKPLFQKLDLEGGSGGSVISIVYWIAVLGILLATIYMLRKEKKPAQEKQKGENCSH